MEFKQNEVLVQGLLKEKISFSMLTSIRTTVG